MSPLRLPGQVLGRDGQHAAGEQLAAFGIKGSFT